MAANNVSAFTDYIAGDSMLPLLIQGDAIDVLASLPDCSVDMAITSPPYYMKREYLAGGIGLEDSYSEYIDNLVDVFKEVYRVLKPTGSFWLNLGDSYQSKNLLMIPQRVAIRLTDEVGFTLRNQVVWNKLKGAPDNAKDRLRTLWEPVFFFTKEPSGYYYDVDAVRKKPRKAKSVEHGAVVSATGVSGVRYRRKIELSTELSEEEKKKANKALDDMLHLVETGEVPDFRMVIRGATRTTHGDSKKLSGRAKELAEKGFYFLKYSNKGAKISDVWDIIPEDTQGRRYHYAPYPEDLVKNPIALTCPPSGIVLDPFVGTGTTCKVAHDMQRKSVGIDLAAEYLEIASRRCKDE
ncbi:DNA-methyltransferase [Ligilactobacillus ruminis]|nr:site-specific DNA-methyltransferase [Ligilactobacillus ruminis]